MTERSIETAPTKVFEAGRLVKIFLCAAICVLLAEVAGTITIPLGGKLQIVLMPLLWGLILGVIWSLLQHRLPAALKIDREHQMLSATILQPALLIFIAKLGLLVGGNLPIIFQSGWALAFQEFGHFFGTMIFGLPVALLLGIKREAIGATFSVGREPSLAIIGEKYGMDSPEGHGVLAEYFTGTVFGAVFIAIFAGFIASLRVFNPLALAMGAGVGSGSMMAAATSAIAAQEAPDVAKQVAAFAAAANLITVTIGTYFTLFLSLPFTEWLYGKLEPAIGMMGKAVKKDNVGEYRRGALSEGEQQQGLSFLQLPTVWIVSGLMALFGNWYNYGTVPNGDTLLGLSIIIGIVAFGYIAYRLTNCILPAVVFVSLLAMTLTYPGVPYSTQIATLTGKLNFMALATPVIVFAGLSIAKDLPVFRKLGWRIVLVSLLSNLGTFIGATLIAQFLVHPHS